ncbi:MAG: hypothetical protein AB8B87_09215 [Granulosicoccus sp.]
MSNIRNHWQDFTGRIRNVSIASCITYALASIAHSHYIVGQVERMGVTVSLRDQLHMTLGDLMGLYVYAMVIAIGLALAWTVMAGVRRLTGLSRWIVYPLAGALAMITIMSVMSMAFPMTPIAPARDIAGIVGQSSAGLIGGCIFAWLQERERKPPRRAQFGEV